MLPNRKAMRLQGFDYSSRGYYFLTICSREKRCLFSHITGGGILDSPQANLTEIGHIIEKQLEQFNEIYRPPCIEHYVIMPNHVHLLVNLPGADSDTPQSRKRNPDIPGLVSTLKRFTNQSIGEDVWQRGYYDHIVRDGEDYLRICQYMDDNPVKWTDDEYYQPLS